MTTAALMHTVRVLTAPPLRAATHALWGAPGLAARYPAYLVVMHGLIRTSVPLMAAAADACDRLPSGDRSAGPLAAYLHTHIEEERGHDDWLLADLSALGMDAGAVLRRAPAAETASLAGAQYYWIQHFHPACLLGYIAVLEGYPPDPAMVDQLPARTGLPSAAFRTLAAHAHSDPGHGRDLDRLLATLPLPAPVAAALARNTAYTATRAAGLLRRLVRDGPDAARSPTL